MAKSNPNIEYHADDFGLFQTQSQRIFDCFEHGRLNGVSIMPNGYDLEACMERLKPVLDRVAVTVHLTLWEGSSLAGRDLAPDLSDEYGNLCCSFGSLLLRSFLPGREKLRCQLKAEIWAQIRAVESWLQPGTPLRLDGHAHYHMLPVAFDAMMDVIREDGLNVSYIRIPQEHVGIYLRHWKQLRDFAPINLVKVLILNILAWRNRRKYRTELASMDQKLFLGVFLSGRMYRDNVEPLLPDALALARKKGWDLELLAHPGGVYEEADIKRLTSPDDVRFLTSEFRNKEATLFRL